MNGKRVCRQAWGLVLLLGLLSSVSQIAAPAVHAQTWPSKNITMVVPSATGGSTDFMARIVAEPLGKALGQTVIVDNKPGASGNIGTLAVARSAPNGYSLLMQYSGYQVGNHALVSNLP